MKDLNAILITDDYELSIDGTPSKHVNLSNDEQEITFVFEETAYNLDILKEFSFGEKILHDHNYYMTINDIKFDVIGYGTESDSDTEITFFLVKS